LPAGIVSSLSYTIAGFDEIKTLTGSCLAFNITCWFPKWETPWWLNEGEGFFQHEDEDSTELLSWPGMEEFCLEILY
jgi:hypothetical protein